MNPDEKDDLEKIVVHIDVARLHETFDRLIDDAYAWNTHIPTNMRPKFQDGDLVLTKCGKTGFVDETFFDDECTDLVVRFTNNDMYFQNELTLLCSAA